MKSLRLATIAALVLAGAATCFAQRGGHGAGSGGHMGGPPSGLGGGAATSGTDHGRPSSSQTQSQQRSPEQLLDQNSKLTANLQKLLPAGTTPQQACSGFSNLGQCVAAIHVANNLGISFSDLKNKVTGTGAESLGQAIHDLNPNVDSKAEKKKADQQAKNDMNGSSS